MKAHIKIEKKGNERIIINTNMDKFEVGEYVYYSSNKNKFVNCESITELAKRNHGLAVRVSERNITLYNDPFSSLPIYVYIKDNNLVISSDFESLSNYSLSLDKVGIYEYLMYSSGLYDRTLFNEIKQMPAATKVTIDLTSFEYDIENYWDYSIEVNKEIDSEEKAKNLVWDLFCKIYSSYANSDCKQFLMGVSGGLDSRLSLGLLARVESNRNNIHTFTFGHSRNIKDYKYAKETCKRLSLEAPQFIKLRDCSYKESKEIVTKSGGAVGIGHCHAWWCMKQFKTEELSDMTYISNYYSDAVMGYDCRPNDVEDFTQCDYYQTLEKNEWNAPSDVIDIVRNDLCKIIERRSENDNFSGYNDYIYLTERNPKFHVQLNHLYSEIINVVAPFTEYELLETVLGCPKEYRYYKSIEKMMISDHIADFHDVSSNRYGGREMSEKRVTIKAYYDIGFVLMLILNRMNVALKLLSNGLFQLPNPYITENHLAMVDRVFSEEKKRCLTSLCGIIDKNILDELLKKTCIRTANAEKILSLISLNEMIQFYIGDDNLVLD